MAATLKLCLVVHLEEGEGVYNATTAAAIGLLATVTGQYGAKLSVQMGAEFASHDGAGMHPASGTSLGAVLKAGGNFWLHMHQTDAAYLTSAQSCVQSLYEWENVGASNPCADTAAQHVSGRSGGTGVGANWVSIAMNAGLRAQNCGTFKNYQFMPTSLRPYGFTDDEIDKLYFHDVAPGPILHDIYTMRMRPFWMQQTTMWYQLTTLSYATSRATDNGSLMMIPKPSRFSRIMGCSGGRSATEYSTLTNDDLKLCLTEIYSCWNLMDNSQSSITNVWYKLLAVEDLTPATIQTLGVWVQSINEVARTSDTPPHGIWKNMNEIANLFSHTTSMYA